MIVQSKASLMRFLLRKKFSTYKNTPTPCFYMINTPQLPITYTLYLTLRKFSLGFESLGYKFLEITNDNQLGSIPNNKTNVFLLGNHGLESKGTKEILHKMAIKNPDSIFILWHFHTMTEKEGIESIPFKKYILTGECYEKYPEDAENRRVLEYYSKFKNYLPIKFAASIFPDNVGKIKRNVQYDVQYVGTPYKTEWINKLPFSKMINTKAVNPFFSESDRINTFLSSHIGLGFHNDGNIKNGLISERVFEAMAYGCVVVTDNPTASQVTDGNAILVSTYEELVETINMYISDEQKRIEKQILGYEYVKNNRTYVHTAKSFINKFKELEFEEYIF
jgi:Glycosyl transferases group 1